MAYLLLLKNPVTVLQLIERHIQTLPHRTDPGIANNRRKGTLNVSLCLRLFEKALMRYELRHTITYVSKGLDNETGISKIKKQINNR